MNLYKNPHLIVMKNFKDLKIKTYEEKGITYYINYKKKIILKKEGDRIENIDNMVLLQSIKEKKILIKNNSEFDCLDEWVYKFMKMDEDILKAQCTFWDGHCDEKYETEKIKIDKSVNNKVIISYNKKLYKKVFWFIYSGITTCYYWDIDSEIYINNKDIEDYIDLINYIKEHEHIEILLNNIAYEAIKDVKITIGFELF